MIAYDRYTRRYPLQAYDQGLPLTVVTMHTSRPPEVPPDSDAPFGPIVVPPRKRRFSRVEVRDIWMASRGRCHVCEQRWALSRRGRTGWHIDHVIPHIGGGAGTETLHNFRVACAKCNLQKGKGYTRANIERSICLLREYLERSPKRR